MWLVIVCLLRFLAIALSILIQFTASDVSFHIFKRFPTAIMALLQMKIFET